MVEALVATRGGVHRLDIAGGNGGEEELGGQDVTALAGDGSTWWAVVAQRSIVTSRVPGNWDAVAHLPGTAGTCLHPGPAGLLVGTAGAHLLKFTAGRFDRVASFDEAEGRGEWYTPWGGPPDTRSVALSPNGEIYVNVHVGGILRSADEGRSWAPTIDIHADVHQVLAHPSEPGVVLAAAAVGLAVSTDGGTSWRYDTEGLDATYARAVAVSDGIVLMTTSRGPGGQQAAVYRRPLSEGTFERCTEGLPGWFSSNIDTGCLAASGPVAVFGTDDGSVFASEDRGETWRALADGLPPVRSVGLA